MGYTRSRELNDAINKVLSEAKKKDLPGLLAAQREGKVCTLPMFTFTYETVAKRLIRILMHVTFAVAL